MSRWRHGESSDLSHRWMVSYADFITLLFAFFVVMYSISQVSESKYRVLSETMTSVFEKHKNDTDQAEQQNASATDTPGLVSGPVDAGEGVIENAGASQDAISLPKAEGPTEREKQEFTQLYRNIEQSLQGLIQKNLVELRANQDWIEIDIRSGLLFESGSDVLGEAANSVLDELAVQLNVSNNLMRIRGYTDNQMINTDRFPSNWELSSSRAVAVVRKLQSAGIAPERMAVEGFGEYNPIASNDFEEGRARNRRVVMAISRFHSLKDQQPDVLRPPPATTDAPTASEAATPAEDVEVLRLPDGGLLVRDKEENPATEASEPPAEPPPEPR